MTFRCPVHGEVEGVYDSDGPLSNNVPAPIQCEHDHEYGTIMVVGFEATEDKEHDD